MAQHARLYLLLGMFFCFSSCDEIEKQIRVLNKDECSDCKTATIPARPKKKRSPEVLAYYDEIVMNTEWEGRRDYAKKWTTNMKIFVEGDPSSDLMAELYRIVHELNDIIIPINLMVVHSRSNANMIIYFCSAAEFAAKKPSIKKSKIEANWGLFSVGSNSGCMYVDIYRADPLEQKHLLREELTQSLGLMNDSYKYPESIFYQNWTTTTEFASIDKELIDMLYNE